MADIQTPDNRRFWTNSDGYHEPVTGRVVRPTDIDRYRAFLHGKEYYLGQTVYHNQEHVACPVAYNDEDTQRFFEAGFGNELHDQVTLIGLSKRSR